MRIPLQRRVAGAVVLPSRRPRAWHREETPDPIDDDVLSTAETAGKQVGKDAAAGKATLVSLWGVERARAEAEALADRARDGLAPYGDEADLLRALPFHLLDRRA